MDEKYLHRAQYYETDQMGIIHHSNYIRWMEEARMNYLSRIGFPMETIEQKGFVSPVVSVQCRYKKPCRLNELIAISVRVKAYNGVKLVLEYEMHEQESGELRTLGTSEHCFTNKEGEVIALKREYPELDQMLREGNIERQGGRG